MEKHNFARGTLHLKSFSLNDHTRSALLQPPEITKRAAIYQILRDFPERKFILVGDSGERDAEIYADTARQYPDQVLFIFIRKILAPQLDEEGNLTTNPPLPLRGKSSSDDGPPLSPTSLGILDSEDLSVETTPPASGELVGEDVRKEFDDIYRDIIGSEVDLSSASTPLGPLSPTVPTPQGKISSSPSTPSPLAAGILFKDPAERISQTLGMFEAENWKLFEDPFEIQSSQYITQMIHSVIEQ